MISPDNACHARTRLDGVLGSILGLLPAALGLAACGAMLAIVQGTYDIVDIYAKLGMSVLAPSVLISMSPPGRSDRTSGSAPPAQAWLY